MRSIQISIGLLALAIPAFAQVNGHDRMFVRTLGQGNNFEIVANTMALRKARNPEVKQHSRHMVEDHSKAGRELRAWARGAHVPVPSTMSGAQRGMLGRLRGLSGMSFDRAHARMQLNAHLETVALMRHELKDGGDRKLKSWVAKTIPTIEMHRDMWQRAWSTLNMRRAMRAK